MRVFGMKKVVKINVREFCLATGSVACLSTVSLFRRELVSRLLRGGRGEKEVPRPEGNSVSLRKLLPVGLNKRVDNSSLGSQSRPMSLSEFPKIGEIFLIRRGE